MIIPLKELAECLGLSTRRVNQLAKTGVVVLADGQRGKYDLAASVQGYIEFSHAEKNASAGELNQLEQAQLDLKQAQVSAAQRVNALEEGKLVLADNLDTVLLDFGKQINRYLSALPLRVKRRYPEYAMLTNDKQTRLHTMIEDEIRKHMKLMPNVARLRAAEIILNDDNLAEANAELHQVITKSLDQ